MLGLAGSPPADAQEPSAAFATLGAGFAFVNVQPGEVLTGTGFGASGTIGRRLAAHLAGVAQLELTTVEHTTLITPSLLCVSPGCPVPPPRNSATSLALTPGIQLYYMTGHQKLSLTAGPGVMWFPSRPSGTRAFSALLGAWGGWLVGSGPRLGLRLGAEAWLTDGALPRWSIPATVSVHLP